MAWTEFTRARYERSDAPFSGANARSCRGYIGFQSRHIQLRFEQLRPGLRLRQSHPEGRKSTRGR